MALDEVNGVPTGLIVGISVTGLFLVLVFFGVYICYRKGGGDPKWEARRAARAPRNNDIPLPLYRQQDEDPSPRYSSAVGQTSTEHTVAPPPTVHGNVHS